MITLVAQPQRYLPVVIVDAVATGDVVAVVGGWLLASWQRAGRQPWLERRLQCGTVSSTGQWLLGRGASVAVAAIGGVVRLLKSSATRGPTGGLVSLGFAYSLRGPPLMMILWDLGPAPAPSSPYPASTQFSEL